jgi:lipid-A-disaccharide synthase
MKHLFIFSGEPSGDLHGSLLLRAIKQLRPEIKLSGVGGPAMRAEGLSCLIEMEQFQVMGFSDVLLSLPRLWRLFYKVRDAILEQRPEWLVLIDYPGFTLRLAKALRKKGFQGKIVQYICPTVWAHGKQRIQLMAENYDLLLTIFPFEPDYFSHTSLKTFYVGNPLTEIIRAIPHNDGWKESLGIPEANRLIALFPGSRKNEILRNLPKQLAAAALLLEDSPNVCFGLSLSNPEFEPLINQFINKINPDLQKKLFLIPKRFSYDLMRDCFSAIAKSGTITLELALHQKPTVVVYQLSKLNYFIAKYILRLKLPYFCIVNILKNKKVFPELIKSGFTPENVCKEIKLLNENGQERSSCIRECKELASELENNRNEAPSMQAVRAILDMRKKSKA